MRYIQVGPKTGLFLIVDNFAMVQWLVVEMLQSVL